jgi:hypothetical protein
MKRISHLLTKPLLGTALIACGFSAHASLQGRDLDGDPTTYEAYFDSNLNITWLTDANYANTLGLDNEGRMNWGAANNFVANLNIFGVTGWRLPKTSPVSGMSFNLEFSNNGSTDRGYALREAGWGKASELGNLHYVTLRNDKNNLDSTGPFLHLAVNDYWTQTPNNTEKDSAFFFHFPGLQDVASKNFTLNVWPVHDGDVAAVPEPHGWALMLAGLAVLGQLLCRRQA